MRKILSIFCAVFLLSGCSKDDENDSLAKIGEFGANNIETNTWDYLFENYEIVAWFDTYFKRDGYYSAASAICPNNSEKHISENGKYIRWLQLSDHLTYNWYCPQCKAKFDCHTGKAVNDVAKEYKLQIYKLSYNEEKKIWTIWK